MNNEQKHFGTSRKMAPGGVLAARLAQFVILFLLLMLCLLPQYGQTLWTYDRQALFNIRSSVPALSGAGQYYFHPWLVRPLPAEIIRPTGNASGKKNAGGDGAAERVRQRKQKECGMFFPRGRRIRDSCVFALFVRRCCCPCPDLLYQGPTTSAKV